VAKGETGYLISGPDRIRLGVLCSAGLRVTDLDGGEPRTVSIDSEHRRGVDVAQTARGLRVAAWLSGPAFDLLDGAGQIVCRVNVPENTGYGPTTVVMSLDGTRAACVSHTPNNTNEIAVFDAISGKRTTTCAAPGDNVETLIFSADSARLATGSVDHAARVYDAATGKLLATCRGHSSTVASVAFSADGARLVTASPDGTVRQWDANTGREVEPPYDRHSAEIFSAAYSPDGVWVASAGDDRTIRVWLARGRQELAVLHGHTGGVTELAFAPDCLRLASRSFFRSGATSWDGTLRVWDVDPWATLPILRGHLGAVYPSAYSPDGRWLASGSWDRTVRLWDASTGEPCAILHHRSTVEGLAFGPDGTWLVTACNQDDRLRIWDVATARIRKEIPFQAVSNHSLIVSPDGTRVAAREFNWYSAKWRMVVFEIASGKLLLETNSQCLAYSPDGRWLAAVAPDGKTVRLLDARTHETAAEFSGHGHNVIKAAFSPDSRRLATCSADRTVRLWQVGSGECQVLSGHTDELYAVAFHPDGTRLATAGRDGTVWLWDLVRGDAVARLPRHKSFVWSLAFSPDGATLESGSGDHTVRLWDTAPLKQRYQARRAAAALRPDAERLVEQLWKERKDPANVAQAIRSDRMPSEALRHAALRAVQRRAQALDAGSESPQAPPK
jgi:WD40 repeat protein